VQKLIAQLQDEKTKGVLAGFTVRVFDLDAGEALGYDVSDARGLFTIIYTPPQPEDGGRRQRHLRLDISDRRLQPIAEGNITVAPNQKPPLVVTVAVPAEPPPSPTIADLTAELQLEVPPNLGAFLDERHIRTLVDLRATGGLADLQGLPLATDAPIVHRLDAHANLNLLSSDVVKNDQLIDKGFDSIVAVARATRQSFVQAVSGDLGEFGAAQLQVTASAQANAIQNIDGGIRAGLANGGLVAIKIPDPVILYPPRCACADCDAAVSPLAYLADLLDYALRHLTLNAQPITLRLLTETFYQLFGDLPAACAEVDRQERQVRLCIEVLRRYLAANPPAALAQQRLDAQERAYRESAYTALLMRFGASYGDIRLARTAADTARRAIAARLGIGPQATRPDHLDALFLDPRAAHGDPREITEPTLERLLGLVDTRRDPLSDGAKEHDGQGQLARWTFAGVVWNRNTDSDGLVHLRLSHAGNDYTIEVFRDPRQGAAALVASGTALAATGPVTLYEENGSGLSGRVLLNYRVDDAAITIALVPNLLSWRLAQLRSLWRDQDWPVDRFQDAFQPAADREPLIDPDVIGPDDFRTPVGKPPNPREPDAPFDIWIRRRSWVDDRLRAFAAMRQVDGTPDLAAMLKAMTAAIDYAGGAPKAAWPNNIGPADLDQLRRNLAEGQDMDATRLRIRTELNLAVDAFTRLMTLRQKDQDAAADARNPPVTLAEWRDVYSVLTQAWKTAFLPEWRAEEAPLLFGPAEFWPSLREPQPGEWPLPFQQPLIDPEFLAQDDVATTRAGDAALRLWQGRRAVLDQIAADIRAAREVRGFDAMSRQALGDPAPGDPLPVDFAALVADLQSGDPVRIGRAVQTIGARLFLTPVGFEMLAQLRDSDAAGRPIAATQWAAAYTLLTRARKVKQLDAGWRQEESQLPLIDPETVRRIDLPDPAAGARPADRLPYAPERTLALWNTRRAALEQMRQDLRRVREAGGLDAAIRNALGDPNPGDPLPHNLDLEALNADLTSGVAARAAPAQAQIAADLYMTVEAFARLIAIKLRNDDPNARQPTAAEWADAYAILASAAKEKRAYPAWRQQEQDPLTGVVYWQALKAALPLWRASAERRAAWRQGLQRRSQPPLVDPDLVGPGDFRDQVSGPVFDLWLARGETIAVWLGGLRNPFPHAPDLTRIDNLLAQSVFDARAATLLRARLRSIREARGLAFLLAQLFGDPLPDFDALAAALAANDANARIQIAETLYLTIDGFEQLVAIRALDLAGQPVTPAQWDAVYNILALEALVRAALSAVEAQRQGQDVSGWLAQLGFSTAAFTYVVGLRDAAARQAPLLDAEWEDLYSILVQLRKERSAALWRNQEAPAIILGPDQFRIADPPPLQFPPPPPRQLPAWRASTTDRQAWLDQLQARIDQESAVRSAYDQTLSQTDADLLPGLRDALVLATDPNPPVNPPLTSLRDKARWVTDHLLIDAETDGCQLTTRVSTAITTIQDLLWSVRLGLLAEAYPQLALDADEFDAEWTWIGGYANWRAATFVFLYPENLLVPSLRRRQTPPFAALVDGLRANTAIGPAQACDAAASYGDYFRDVASLSLVTACQAATRLHTEDCRNRTELADRSLLYFFATGARTKTLYWSAFDAVEAAINADFAQTFWEAVPAFDPGVLVLAAVPFVTAGGDRYIYVFAHDQAQQKLLYVKYTRDAQAWMGSAGTLDFAHKEGETVTIVVKQRGDETEPPQIAVQTDGRIALNRLNRDGDAWAGDKWTVLATSAQQIGRIVAMIGIGGARFFVFARANDASIQYRCFGNAGDPFWHSLGQGDWCGASAWPDTDKVYAFWNDGGSPNYRRLQAADLPPLERVSPGDNAANIYPQRWSLWLLDLWLMRACGIALSTISAADVVNLGGETTLRSVFELLAFAPDEPPRKNYPPAVWDQMLTRLIEGLGNYIKNSEDWTFADDLLLAAGGSRILPTLGAILDQHLLDLPDGAKGAVLIGNLLVALLSGAVDPAYYEPPVVGGNTIAGLVAIAACASDAVLPAPLPGAPQGDTILVAYQRSQFSDSGVYWSAWTRDAASDLLTTGPEIAAAPVVAGPFDITERLTAAALQLRRQQIADDFLQNTPGPLSNLIWLEEAYYFVPVQIALQLQQRGQYTAALDWLRSVYDWSAPAGERKIYYGLSAEESLPTAFTRAPDWLLDPLNPHAIAETRADSYTRFTLISLIRCLLQDADAEFTNDTAESVPRAARLYEAVLDLLKSPEIEQRLGLCDQVIGTLDINVGGPEWVPVANRIKDTLTAIGTVATLKQTVDAIANALDGKGPAQDRLGRGLALAQAAVAQLPSAPSFGAALGDKPAVAARASRLLLANPAIAEAAVAAGATASQDFLHAVSYVSGIPARILAEDNPPLPWLGDAGLVPPGNGGGFGLPPFGDGIATRDPLDMLIHLKGRGNGIFVPAPSYDFCIPPNPVLQVLRLRAELNLYKLRTCRDIAGVKRALDPYAAPTDTTSGLPQIGPGGALALPGTATLRPTAYRYKTLIERAKQLVTLASQIEAAMLAALEKRDAEFYAQLKARQDVSLTLAGVRLQDLRVQQAQDGVTLATLQQQRAQLQQDHYQQLLNEGVSSLESAAIGFLFSAAGLQTAAAVLSFVASGFEFGAAALAAAWSVGTSPEELAHTASGLSAVGSGLSSLAAAASTTGTVLSTFASYERRAQDWDFQRILAQQDVAITGQQVTIAQDGVRVAGQERAIAQMQADHAKQTLDFLTQKFTNAELYDWMSNVLGGIYGFFLQQATATARLAEAQLSFERQVTPPSLVQADYWDAPGDFAGLTGEAAQTPDRRGLTGSARLLQDIEQLDQYAFDTDRRKLQLAKTLSLALAAPAEFQRFRDTGVLIFATPMELFDHDFPGHYLRLIRRVRVSVIALIPPTQGIRATLSSTGVSRVIVGGDVFQTEVLRRDPETIALSAPQNASGLFELDTQGDMLLPFEGLGVDANWEFRMPRAANPFDYATIADVLVTVDYSALDSADYRQQVLQTLARPLSADRPFSFRNQLADAWYDLHNPDQSATPMVVRFPVTRGDFPPNLDDLRIQQLVLYFGRKPGSVFEVDVRSLTFAEAGGSAAVGGEASSIDGVISTRAGNAGAWTAILGKPPFGQFELALADTPDTRRWFRDDLVEDILFVITYSGRPPPWPA
jgi:hypothetical protein